MRERSYWDDCAEAMELTIEGNRLIVGEIAECIREQWHAAMHRVAEIVHRVPNARHLPPV